MPVKHMLKDGKSTAAVCRNDAFDAECDVLVVGLGTAGASAAIAAARQGCSVIGADAAPLPGGVCTAACVWDYYYGARGGLYREINCEADDILKRGIYLSAEREGVHSYPTSVKSLALEKALDSLGVVCHYSTVLTAVYADGDRVCGVELLGDRPLRIRAKVVIDGANGAVCRILGLPNMGGRRSDGKTARFSRTIAMRDADGQLCGAWRQGDALPQNVTTEAMSDSYYKWSTQAPCYPERFSKTNRLYGIGYVTGVREVPCVQTEETYTFLDYLNGRRPQKVAFYALSQLDNSCADVWNEDDDYVDWRVLCDLNPYAFSVGVSPKMMIAKGMENLLLAGKHIGTGHIMSSGVRMRTDMEKCGEAAGVLAALSVANHCSAGEIAESHFDEYRRILAESGCYNADNDRGVCDMNLTDGEMWRSCPLPKDTGELKRSLMSTTPGLGLLALRMGRIPIDGTVAAWLRSDHRLLRENTAVALGMLGDTASLPVLREILKGDTETVTHYWDEWNYFWYSTSELCNFVKAACLLARFRDPADEERMRQIAFYEGKNPIREMASHYAKRYFGIYEQLEAEVL